MFNHVVMSHFFYISITNFFNTDITKFTINSIIIIKTKKITEGIPVLHTPVLHSNIVWVLEGDHVLSDYRNEEVARNLKTNLMS